MLSYSRQTLVDRIVYTASLATRMSEIDQYLDKLRATTSQSTFSSETMTDQEYATLSGVQQQLEQYLVEREPLRSFTNESLQVQVEQHLAGNVETKQGLLKVTIILVLALVAATLGGVLPGVPGSQQQQIILAGAVATCFLNLGASWLFLSALPAFKSQLRRAFGFICTGIVLFSVAILSEPLIELANLRANSDIVTILVMPIVFLSALSMYVGVVRYARLIGVTSRLLKGRFLLLLLPIIPVAFLVHAHSAGGSGHMLILSLLLHIGVVALTVVAVILLFKILPRLADLYKPPARALLQAIITLMVGALTFASIVTNGGPRLTSPMATGLLVFLFATGSMLVRAGYIFNKISQY